MFSNQINDITALANKPTLTSVSLAYNKITDISPLETAGISNSTSGNSVAFQAVSLPGVWLNPNTDSFSSSSFIYNLLGENVSVTPYYTDGSGAYQYAMYYKSTATGTNISGQNISWTNFTQNLLTNANGVKYGYMTYYWTDPFLNNAGYPYFGWIIQPFYINDTIGNVTINYVLNETGATIHQPSNITGSLATQYQVDQDSTVQQAYQQLIDQGYYLYRTSGATTGTFIEQAQSATLYFSKTLPTYEFNVHYQTKTGRTIIPDQTYAGKMDITWTVDTTPPAGYRYLYAKDATGNIITDLTGKYSATVGDITLVFALIEGTTPTYEPSTLHVNFVDQNDNEIKAGNIQNGYVGNGYDVTAPEISGYRLTFQANYQGQLTATDQTVTFTYELIEGETPTYEPSTLNVKYVDQNGNPIKTEMVLNGHAGNGYKVDAASIDGYRLISQSNYTGALVAGSQTVSFVYELIEGVVPESKPTTINIEFVDEQGNKIQADINKNGFVGNGYLINAPEITGYHYLRLGTGSAALQGQLIDGETRIILVYAKDTDPVEPTTPIEPTIPTPTNPEAPTAETPVLMPVNSTSGSDELQKAIVVTAGQNNDQEKLPQTDERAGQTEALIGLGMLSLWSGLFGLKKRKKNSTH